MKRLTLDLKDDVHKRLKITCAQLEVPMAELLRQLVADAMESPTLLTAAAAKIHDRAAENSSQASRARSS